VVKENDPAFSESKPIETRKKECTFCIGVIHRGLDEGGYLRD
jgi:hypothetical protein